MSALSLLMFEFRTLWLKCGLLLLVVPVVFVGPYLLTSHGPIRESWIGTLELDLSFNLHFVAAFLIPLTFVYICAYEVNPERMALFLTRPVRKWQMLLARFSVLFSLFTISTAVATYLFFYIWLRTNQVYYPALVWADVAFPANTVLLMMLMLYIIGCAYAMLSAMMSPMEMQRASPIAAILVYILINLVYTSHAAGSFSAIHLLAPFYYSDAIYVWMMSRLTGTPLEPFGPVGDPFTAVVVLLAYFTTLLLASVLVFERRDVV